MGVWWTNFGSWSTWRTYVNIISKTISYIGTFRAQSDGAKEGVMFKMACCKAEYNEMFRPNSEIEEISWLDSNDTDRISEVDKLIFSHLVRIDELNWSSNKGSIL